MGREALHTESLQSSQVEGNSSLDAHVCGSPTVSMPASKYRAKKKLQQKKPTFVWKHLKSPMLSSSKKKKKRNLVVLPFQFLTH